MLRSLQQHIWRSTLFPLLTCGAGILLFAIASIVDPGLRAGFDGYVRVVVFLVMAFVVLLVGTAPIGGISPFRGGGARGVLVLIGFFGCLIGPLVLAVGLWLGVRAIDWNSAWPYRICDWFIGLELGFFYGLLLVNMVPLSALTAAVGVFFGIDFAAKMTADSLTAFLKSLLTANATIADAFLRMLKGHGIPALPRIELLSILLFLDFALFLMIAAKVLEKIWEKRQAKAAVGELNTSINSAGIPPGDKKAQGQLAAIEQCIS